MPRSKAMLSTCFSPPNYSITFKPSLPQSFRTQKTCKQIICLNLICMDSIPALSMLFVPLRNHENFDSAVYIFITILIFRASVRLTHSPIHTAFLSFFSMPPKTLPNCSSKRIPKSEQSCCQDFSQQKPHFLITVVRMFVCLFGLFSLSSQ